MYLHDDEDDDDDCDNARRRRLMIRFKADDERARERASRTKCLSACFVDLLVVCMCWCSKLSSAVWRNTRCASSFYAACLFAHWRVAAAPEATCQLSRVSVTVLSSSRDPPGSGTRTWSPPSCAAPTSRSRNRYTCPVTHSTHTVHVSMNAFTSALDRWKRASLRHN